MNKNKAVVMRTACTLPSTRDVVIGARVEIVLKADQRTGRTVTGSVSEVLTRGNHPRGIKVRLTDGRVGRVQGMASGDGPLKRPDGPADVDLEAAAPRQEVGLGDYVIKAETKRSGRRRNGQSRTGQMAEAATTATAADLAASTATCPVCGDFSGDEAAVAHHVATHFDE